MKTDRDKVSHDVLPYSVLMWSLCVCVCVCWWLIWFFVGLDGVESNCSQLAYFVSTLIHFMVQCTPSLTTLQTFMDCWPGKNIVCLCGGKEKKVILSQVMRDIVSQWGDFGWQRRLCASLQIDILSSVHLSTPCFHLSLPHKPSLPAQQSFSNLSLIPW